MKRHKRMFWNKLWKELRPIVLILIYLLTIYLAITSLIAQNTVSAIFYAVITVIIAFSFTFKKI